MNNRKLILITLFFLTTAGILRGEDLTQTIRGQITDQDAKSPLPGASIVVAGSSPLIGATSDMDGNYVLKNVPVGRVELLVKYLGYEEKYIPNIVVSSTKEVQVDVELKESLQQLSAVEVKPEKDKAENMNEMSIVSAHVVSVEEVKRSPGSFHDPARMVSTFAGVTSDPQGDNSIIVRGNSPKGIQWRLEGIEIPNPNHFADEGTSGGPINVLNSDMLSNSAFHTGAFAPEYGNAYSGIMDLQLRNGNKGKPEFSLSAGVLGMEASAEGPFKKGTNSSYLVNYRYSTLSLLDKIGLVDYGGVPEYQDGLYKIHLPTKKAGVFTLFGLGGYSHINQNDANESGEVYSKYQFKSYMGVSAIKHGIAINEKTYLSTNLSFSVNGNATDGEHLDEEEGGFYPEYNDDMRRYTTAVNSALTHKFNAKHTLKTGVGITVYNFRYNTGWFDADEDTFRAHLNQDGTASMLNAFVSWKYRVADNVTLVNGLHYQHFLMNNTFSVEPRSSVNWNFRPKQTLSAGVGLHSRLEPLTQYYSLHYDENGTASMPNKNMELPKAAHFVAGYENRLTENINFKVEAYYQQLFDVAVEDSANSNFSLLNSTGYFTGAKLVNDGSGKNYGLEVTLERYFARQYFFLFTGSLYNSKYTAKDGVQRNTRFNGNFALNAVGGKEFNLGKTEKHRLLGTSVRVTYAGGGYYMPVDLARSIENGSETMDDSNGFSKRGENYFKLNLAVYYTRSLPRVSHTFKIDVENVTNSQAKVSEYYDTNTQTVKSVMQMPILPELRYTLNF